jgi:hypothetical protein
MVDIGPAKMNGTCGGSQQVMAAAPDQEDLPVQVVLQVQQAQQDH